MKKIIMVLMVLCSIDASAQVVFSKFKFIKDSPFGAFPTRKATDAKFKVTGTKTIKTMTVKYSGVDQVNDAICSDIVGAVNANAKHTKYNFFMVTGPYEPGKSYSRWASGTFFYPTKVTAFPQEIFIDYMDKTSDTIHITKDNIAIFFPSIQWIDVDYKHGFQPSNTAQPISKTYWETHDPSPDSIMPNCKVSTVGGVYSLSAVDSIPQKNKEQLFSIAKEWIGRVYKNPKIVIKSENAPTQIVFEGQLTSSIESEITTTAFHGRVELNFKDGRYKWTISDITSHATIMGRTTTSSVENIPRYSMSRGERGAKWLIADLYGFISNFKANMQGQTSEDDW